MKMSLTICAKNADEIRNILKVLSNEQFESNMSGIIDGGSFDYDFVDSDNLYSDDKDKPLINPEFLMKDDE